MELNRKTMQKLLLLVTFAIFLFLGLQNFPVVLGIVRVLIRLLAPFLVGLCIAFILNVLLRLVEERLCVPINRKNWKFWPRIRRPVCLVLSIGLVAGVLFILLFLIVPELRHTFQILGDNLPRYGNQLRTWGLQLVDLLHLSPELFSDLDVDWEKIGNLLTNFLQNSGSVLMDTTLGITTSIFGAVFNLILGLVFSIYILLQKEKLCSQFKCLFYAFLPEHHARRIVKVAELSNRIFSKFVTGQFTEAVIIGLLCFFGMSIFGMPYASMIAALVGFTALIPVFGAFIGTGVGAFLILMVDPMKALWFIVFIVVLQQLEGNLIYPKVVGKSVGLPGIWVLCAVTLGGSTLGIVGMLLGVPLCSVAYCLVREAAMHRLSQKGIDPSTL